jgi:hypothetical protein
MVTIFNIRFIDSVNFIPMALADMPKAFGETELEKGFFPHLFKKCITIASACNLVFRRLFLDLDHDTISIIPSHC